MNYTKIKKEEYAKRIAALRKVMAKDGVDMVMGYSNLVELGIVRYYCGFAPVNENAAIIIPIDGNVTVCAGQAGVDYAEVQNQLEGSIIKIFPEVGEVSGFEYDTEGQLDFAEYFRNVSSDGKTALVPQKTVYTFKAIKKYEDWPTFAKETVWYGRRKGATLYTNSFQNIEIKHQ